jgi:hypothetical protein
MSSSTYTLSFSWTNTNSSILPLVSSQNSECSFNLRICFILWWQQFVHTSSIDLSWH